MGLMGSGGGGVGATGCSDVLVADGLRAAAFFRVVAFLAAGFLRVVAFLVADGLRAAAFLRVVAFLAAGFLRAVAFLVADGLRAAAFLRVVTFLAAGFLRAAVFFRTAAFVAAVFFRAAGLRTATVFFRAAVFLRVALLVRAAALLLLAGTAITFPVVGDSRIHTIGAVRCAERGERIRTSRPQAVDMALRTGDEVGTRSREAV